MQRILKASEQLTLVVNEVSEAEQAAHDPENGSSRRVLAVEEPLLNTTDGRLRCRALRKPRVEADEGCKAFTLTAGLSCKNEYDVVSLSRHKESVRGLKEKQFWVALGRQGCVE